MKLFKKIIFVLFAIFLVIQFIPVNRQNPQDPNTFNAPPEVKVIFERSCFDCHTAQTEWPWYSFVAPISWLVARDVSEGRKELRLDLWGSYSDADKKNIIRHCIKEIEEGKMPMPIYTLIHTDADITPDQLALIKKWHVSLGKSSVSPESTDNIRSESRHKEHENEEKH
ncbi:MAG: heme-binding domain-containing protein [Ignavibacteriales bacterium]|nr:heme-binding domain-containing protein [Ignavibacteriales bacterium]MCF8305712.1 heme-binding domain-containing protein [Ignavibacteriales bacterium]MCF8315434.1 heme-binding domain-containing protein [Ignavibacteriales bacterium]MCF8437038.1 heme-binding domain-containing protein [Ignavibacteriales bacterium]